MIDSTITGTDLDTVRFPIERSKLAELARAFHDEDPVWHDVEAATAAGFEAVPVPPTVTVLADHWRRGGALGPALALGADLRRLLHGEAGMLGVQLARWVGPGNIRRFRVRFTGQVWPGDELTFEGVVDDITERDREVLAAVSLRVTRHTGDEVLRASALAVVDPSAS